MRPNCTEPTSRKTVTLLGDWSQTTSVKNERNVRILCVDVAACTADIAFVIDNSVNIRNNDPPGVNNWRLLLNFVKSIIEDFTIGQDATRVAVIDFGIDYPSFLVFYRPTLYDSGPLLF